jgi:RHS repeat-associated protein
MTSIQYPNGASYSYGYDTMARLSTMTNGSTQIITGTTYDPANRLLTMSGNSSVNESRTYNAMGQLTQLTSSPYLGTNVNITYSYSSTQNNGKITSQTDNVSGEQVVYAYDSLNRLASATATSGSWGQSYGYDGFGNLQDQTVTAGTAPSLSVVYNAATNQQTTDCADANGNVIAVTGCAGQTLYLYDAKNRISTANLSGGGKMSYTYAPDNKRVARNGADINGNPTLSEITFWSVTGQKLMSCDPTPGQAVYQNNAWVETLNCPATATNVYFGGKLISNGTGLVTEDRLGSIGKFYPWGQEKPSATTNGTEKFTGYFRDAETTLDYAKARYHQPGMGRFLTPDPYMAGSGGMQDPTNPGTWDQYAYVTGDPINFNDTVGLYACCSGTGPPDPLLPNAPGDPPDNPCYGTAAVGVHAEAACAGGGGWGGGGGGQVLKITKVSTTSKQAQQVQNDLRSLKSLIDADPTCLKWLSGHGISPDQAITFILGGLGATAVTAGVGNFNGSTTNAVEGTGGTNLPAGSMTITVNLNGAFFSSGLTVGFGLPTWITGGTLAAQYEILLHELAHFVQATDFIDNDTSLANQTTNNQAVMANCGTIVNAAGGH